MNDSAIQQARVSNGRLADATRAIWRALSGSGRRQLWDELNRSRRIALILLEMAVIGGGMFNFHLNPPFIGAILLYAWLFNRGRPLALMIGLGILYPALLFNSIDEILNIAPLLLRENFLPAFLALVVLPGVLALLANRWFPYFKTYRVFICASTVITAASGNLLIRSAVGETVDLQRLRPTVTPILIYEAPMGVIETPRTLLFDKERNLLWVSYRYRAFTPPADGYLPISLDRIDLTDGSRNEIRLDGGEAIGVGLDEASGRVYASLARRPLDNPIGLGDAVRELVALEPDGRLFARHEMPGAAFDYYNWIFIDRERVLIHGEKQLLIADNRLSSFTSQPTDPSPTWTFCGAAFNDEKIFRVFSGAPLKGFFFRAFSIDVISPNAGKSLRRAKYNYSGLYDIKFDPQNSQLLAINNFVDRAQVNYLDSDLNVTRIIELPGVVRAFAANFERRWLATVEYVNGEILLFDIDSGRQLGEITLGFGSRGIVFGRDGELYVGADIGIFRLDTATIAGDQTTGSEGPHEQ